MSADASGLTTGELEALTAATRRAFSETSDPAAYVARPATEATLGEVGAWLAESGGTAALGAIIASPGFGTRAEPHAPRGGSPRGSWGSCRGF